MCTTPQYFHLSLPSCLSSQWKGPLRRCLNRTLSSCHLWRQENQPFCGLFGAVRSLGMMLNSLTACEGHISMVHSCYPVTSSLTLPKLRGGTFCLCESLPMRWGRKLCQKEDTTKDDRLTEKRAAVLARVGWTSLFCTA